MPEAKATLTLNINEPEKQVLELTMKLGELQEKYDKVVSAATEFIDKTAEMRDAQQDFFKHRDKGVMKLAMHLEKEVDQLIRIYRSNGKKGN